MRSVHQRNWKPWLIPCPFVLGMVGFLISGESVLQAAYQSICLYGMGYQNSPANAVIEIARWLAPLATAGSVVLAVTALRRRLRVFAARRTGKSVAVYGPAAEKKALLTALGSRGIDMDKEPVKAHSYILMGEEGENLEFYHTHLAQGKADVYLKCRSLPAQAGGKAALHLFCPEEMAARLFWKTCCPYRMSAENGHRMTIVLLGFEKLGRELLLSGLQNNIFHAGQRIEYHVFGEEDGFAKVYHELQHISDPVVFHPESWKDSLALLGGAQMIIVAQQEEQLSVLSELILALPGKTIHVLSAQPEGTNLLAQQAELRCFDWKKETLEPDIILGERLSLYAKQINLRYAHLYQDVEETDAAREEQWLQLDSFTRYSNISAADYHSVQLAMLGDEPLTDEKLEWLAELEHIRWCRYHRLNNWKYGIPENGKSKDAQKRIHRCLVPYAELSEEERNKDRENIRILLELDGEKAGNNGQHRKQKRGI